MRLIYLFIFPPFFFFFFIYSVFLIFNFMLVFSFFVLVLLLVCCPSKLKKNYNKLFYILLKSKNKAYFKNPTGELQELEKSIASRLDCWHWCLQPLMCHCQLPSSDGGHRASFDYSYDWMLLQQGEQTTSDWAYNIQVIYLMLALSCNEKSLSPHKWNACLFSVFMVHWKPHWREAGNLFFSSRERAMRSSESHWLCLKMFSLWHELIEN